MCTNMKFIHNQGRYKESTYRGNKGEEYNYMTYSKCGHCPQCIAEKANNWVIRNYYESRAHKDISFITVTYEKSTFFLIKKDFQDFSKRLRKEIWKRHKKHVRLFIAGEYGERTNRPHAHYIIYGWKDKNAKFLRLSKRNNPIYESELINKTWGKGITAYQPFEKHEIPYITLYNTAKETERKNYLIHKNKALELIEKLKKEKTYKHRHNMIKELYKEIKKCEKEKRNWIELKEFNLWSKSLGWEEFYKEFKKNKNYDFKEYIDNTEFVTPTPWVKKLANMGYKSAIAEMFRREAELATELKNPTNLNKLNLNEKRIKEIIEYTETPEREL